jgi:hypothetical protein
MSAYHLFEIVRIDLPFCTVITVVLKHVSPVGEKYLLYFCISSFANFVESCNVFVSISLSSYRRFLTLL